MKEITFTENELNDMKKTLGIVLDDMRSLYQTASLEKIYIDFAMNYSFAKDWMLLLEKDKVIIYEPQRDKWLSDKFDIHFAKERITLEEKEEQKVKKGLMKKPSLEVVVKRNNLETIREQNCIFRFLARYEEIRKELLNIIAENNQEKEKISQTLENLRAKYSGEVLIDFGPSKAQNIQTLEVVEDENGQKVGTINFGSRTIKIVTDGEIILVNRTKAKQKIK